MWHSGKSVLHDLWILDERSHQYLSNGDKNIYLYQGDIDGNLVDYLGIIEYEDNLKLYASVWQVDDNGEMVLTRNGKVAISKEPSSTLLRLLGNSLDSTVFLWIQHGTSRSLADVQKLIHRQVLTKMNEDRPYFEARGAWKKVKGDFDDDGPPKVSKSFSHVGKDGW